VPAHFFVADLADPVVADEDLHHAQRVLRLRQGEEITVSDGAGGWRRCRWTTGGRAEPESEIATDPKPDPPLTVGFALTKGEKGTTVVQKLTECGVDRIIPFVAERSIVRWDGRKQVEVVDRWRRIAREASMQSQRTWLPTVNPVIDFDGIARSAAPVIAHMDGSSLAPGDDFVLVGPEGGWSERELGMGGRRVRLAPHVLRAETAAVAAGVLLTALRAKLITTA